MNFIRWICCFLDIQQDSNNNKQTSKQQKSQRQQKINTDINKNVNQNKIQEKQSNSSLYDQLLPSRAIGIKNIGNTCYIGSVLQCLLKSQVFVFKISQQIKKKKFSSLSNNFAEFTIYMNSKQQKISFNPQQIKNIVSNKNSLFANYNQQDASQFLSNFLSIIGQQLNISVKHQKLQSIDHLIRLDEIPRQKQIIKFIYQQTKKNDQSICKSVIEQTFTGRYQVTYTCKYCQQIYVLFQKFNIHLLQIPEKIKPQTIVSRFNKGYQFQKCDLRQCLLKFTQKEELFGQNQMTCENCKGQTDHFKVMQIYQPNQILAITIKRFYKGLKNTAKINLPQCLPIQEVVMEDRRSIYQGKVYKLYSAILHQGNLNGGHYISYCLQQRQNLWVQYNDDKVSKPKKYEDISLDNAYIVFYKLTDKNVNKNLKQETQQLKSETKSISNHKK